MARAKRKTLSMIVTVSVPVEYSPGGVHDSIRGASRLGLREIGDDEIKVRSVKPAGRIMAAARMAWDACGRRAEGACFTGNAAAAQGDGDRAVKAEGRGASQLSRPSRVRQ